MPFSLHIKFYSLLLVGSLISFMGVSQKLTTNNDTSISKTVPDTLNHFVKSKNALENKVNYKAEDSLQIDIQNKKVYLFGNAEVYYENIVLKSAYIEIDFGKNLMYSHGLKDSTGKVKGNPIFKEGKQKFKAKEITYNFKTKKGKINNVFTNQDQGYIHGETIKKVDNNSFFIEHGKYTTCENEDPHFYIAAKKLKVVNKDKIVTGPACLVIAEVPTPLAIPFGFFPNTPKKTSGILIPTYGESPLQGFFFENGGYYFAINDFKDLTFRGSIYTKGSWRASSEMRYKKRYKSSGTLSFDYSNRKFGVKTVNFTQTEDFSLKWRHSQDAKARPNSSFSASVNAGTSTYNQNNTYNPDNFLAGSLSSTIAFRKNWKGKPYSFSANARHSQNTKTTALSITLPELYFGVNRINPFKSKTNLVSKKWYKNIYENLGISYTTNFKSELTTVDSLFRDAHILETVKTGVRHSLPVSTSFKLLNNFTVTPSFSYNENWYRSSTEIVYNPIDSIAITSDKIGFARVYNYSFNTSLSTNIYGMFAFKGKYLKAIRHVMRPSISFNFKPDFSEEKWGFFGSYKDTTTTRTYNRFNKGIYGGASPGRSESIGFSLNNNFEMKVSAKNDSVKEFKKIKLLDALNFSGNYNFAADSLNFSTLAMSARTTIAKKLNITTNATLDPYVLGTNNIRINTLRFDKEGKLGRITRAYAALSYRLRGKGKTSTKISKEDKANLPYPYSSYIDFNIPWNVSFNYSINYSKATILKTVTQSLSFNGDIKLTPKWKISGSSGYDFVTKDLTYTTLNFHRDLHCWEMRMSWVPFGTRQSYNFTINVKSSVLQDLKLNRRREWFDNTP